MDIRDMHTDFKIKYNKISSEGNENLQIPEIDWLLNEAMEIFIRNIAEPFNPANAGFELNQRSIDHISNIVVRDTLTGNNNLFPLKDDYFFNVSLTAEIEKSKCGKAQAIVRIVQHDDLYLTDSFYKSSFEWRELNANFEGKNIRVYPEGFTVNKLEQVYIKRPDYMHDAEDFNPGGYKMPSGELLTGRSHCIFPDDVCHDIVDIAVLLASQNTGLVPQFNMRLNKLSLKQIKNN